MSGKHPTTGSVFNRESVHLGLQTGTITMLKPSAWHKNPHKGEQLFPWADGILAGDREEKLLRRKVEGNFLVPC